MSTLEGTGRPRVRPRPQPLWMARWRPGPRFGMGLVVTAVLVYLIIGPLAMLLASSAQDTATSLPLSSRSTWSLTNYRAVFADSDTWRVLVTTLEYAFGSLVVAGVVSIGCAWLVERTDIPLRRTLYVLVIAGSGIPGLVFAISWNLLLNPTNGVLNQALRAVLGVTFNALSLPGMILVEGIRLVPLMFLLISASFRGMSGSLEDAAATSGGSLRTTLRRVTLPLVAPALIAAMIYNFVNAVEWVDIPLVLGLPGHVTVLSTKIYLSVHPPIGLPNYGLSSTYGLLMVLLSIVPLIAYQRLIRRSNSYATITGKGYRPRRIPLGRWRIPALLCALAYVAFAFVLPLLILFWATIQPYYAGISRAAFHRIVFKGYSAVLHSHVLPSTVGNTLLMGVAAAAGTIALSLASSWLIVRARSRAAGALDFLVFFPQLIPSIVVGLAILLVYLILPVSVFGTIWIIVIAMITKYIALGTRLTTPGIAQVHASLEEAAAVSGGAPRQVWRRVLLPLLRPVLTNSFLIVFVVSVQNLTLALMLVSPGNSVLSTVIWNYWDQGDVASATVLSLLTTLITVTVATALRGTGVREDYR